MNRTIALLTDFGTSDTYVGVMKAVMSRICPEAFFIDLTHEIPPQNVRQGAFTLLRNYRFFEPGTVFLVVVDPGVGTTRKAIAAQAGDYFFVGPDNGVLSYALAELENPSVVELSNHTYQLTPVSNTFHGRDIFAPAAAHLAAGVSLQEFGAPVERIAQQLTPSFKINMPEISGQIMFGDHFGNLTTSIGELRWINDNQLELRPRFGKTTSAPIVFSADNVTITIGDQIIKGIQRLYGNAKKGELIALIDSGGHLEIAQNQGSAASQLNAASGLQVTLKIG